MCVTQPFGSLGEFSCKHPGVAEGVFQSFLQTLQLVPSVLQETRDDLFPPAAPGEALGASGRNIEPQIPLIYLQLRGKRHKSKSDALIATERREVIEDVGGLSEVTTQRDFIKHTKSLARLLLRSISRTSDKIGFSRTFKRKQTLKINLGKLLLDCFSIRCTQADVTWKPFRATNSLRMSLVPSKIRKILRSLITLSTPESCKHILTSPTVLTKLKQDPFPPGRRGSGEILKGNGAFSQPWRLFLSVLFRCPDVEFCNAAVTQASE